MLGPCCRFTGSPAVHMNLNQGSSPWWLGLTPHCLPELEEADEPQMDPTPDCCRDGPQRLLPEGAPRLEPQPLPLITWGALLVCAVTEGKAWKKHELVNPIQILWGNSLRELYTYLEFRSPLTWAIIYTGINPLRSCTYSRISKKILS